MGNERGWFSKLKALFNLEFNSPIVQVNLTRGSHNKTQLCPGLLYDEENRLLDIDLEKIPRDKVKHIRTILRESIDEGNRLLTFEANNLLERLYDYNKKNPDGAILNFFKPILPPQDFAALESALFLRKCFRDGENVNKLKQDIRKRFGDRGNNIANLCSAGYFEGFLMPLYNQSKEDFKRIYEDIVANSMVTVFVYAQMKEEEIPAEIRQKLQISRKYGIKWIHVHGIGTTNIQKIKSCINEYKEDLGFFDKNIYEGEGIIVVQLLFK
jgi:hypothetical protein